MRAVGKPFAQPEEVVIIGRQGPEEMTVDELADTLGTIDYEIMAHLATRVPRIAMGPRRPRLVTWTTLPLDGVVTHTYVPYRRRPVETYLQGQGRYRHLFEPTRNDTAMRRIQAQVDHYWAEVAQTTGS